MAFKIPVIITEEELLQVLKVTKKNHHKLAFVLGFYECMRVSEICGLKKAISKCCGADIKLFKENPEDKKSLRKCSKCNKQLGEYEFLRHKTEWQVYPLVPEMVNKETKLIHIKSAKGSKDRMVPIAPESMKALKFLPVGSGIRALQIKFKENAKKALGKDLHFHILRHSGITHYITKKGWSSFMVQQFAGHSNITTTQIYTHVRPEHLVDQMWGRNE